MGLTSWLILNIIKIRVFVLKLYKKPVWIAKGSRLRFLLKKENGVKSDAKSHGRNG
jgi:hypothetical protein